MSLIEENVISHLLTRLKIHRHIYIISTCLLFCEYLNDDKVPSFSLTLRSEQHIYHTRSALSDHLVIESFRTDLRKFSASISSKYFWSKISSCILQKPSKKKNNLNVHCCSVLILYNYIYICSAVLTIIPSVSIFSFFFCCQNI